MMRLVVFIAIGILTISCENEIKPQKPGNLIAKDKMEAILYDLYVINAAKGINKKILEAKGFIPETYVFTKHNIDSTQFADSNAYYAFDTEGYKQMVENVKSKLEKQKEIYQEIQKVEGKEAKRKRDSIKRIKDSISRLKSKAKDSIKLLNKTKPSDSIKVL